MDAGSRELEDLAGANDVRTLEPVESRDLSPVDPQSRANRRQRVASPDGVRSLGRDSWRGARAWDRRRRGSRQRRRARGRRRRSRASSRRFGRSRRHGRWAGGRNRADRGPGGQACDRNGSQGDGHEDHEPDLREDPAPAEGRRDQRRTGPLQDERRASRHDQAPSRSVRCESRSERSQRLPRRAVRRAFVVSRREADTALLVRPERRGRADGGAAVRATRDRQPPGPLACQ